MTGTMFRTTSRLIVVAAVLSSSLVCWCHSATSCRVPYPTPPPNSRTQALPTGIASNIFDLLNGLAAQKYIVIVSCAH